MTWIRVIWPFDRLRDQIDRIGEANTAILDYISALKPGKHENEELTEEVIGLKRQVAQLEIDRAKIEEEYARGERELKHMVGLEQQRQEAEAVQSRRDVEQATRQAKLEVREENLAADRRRFEEQLEQQMAGFKDLKEVLVDQNREMIKRLPNVNVELAGTVGSGS